MKKIMAGFALSLAGLPSAAQQSSDECAKLQNVDISGGHITSARAVVASGTLPAYCEIRATALPAISIEVRLPMDGWNGKFYQAGCGALCGSLGSADAGTSWVNAMRPGLERGYATATSDSGHQSSSIVDAEWAYNNPDAERDWGWRSIAETNRVANVLIEAFYGNVSEQAIFQGCSNGGRMAHIASLRYPDMFDGIISGAPAMDFPGLVATKISWIIQANTAKDGSQILGPEEAAIIEKAVLDQCDAVDGSEDGVIADPRQCEVSYDGLGLTIQQLDTLGKWRDGPRNAAGEQLYPGGVPEGSEPFWWLWLTGDAEGRGKLGPALANDFGKYMAFDEDPGPNWSPMDFDFETDPARMVASAAAYNGDNPDISAFRNAGGKMIVYHGWADSLVTPYKTVEWYEQASKAAGGEDALKESVALFMVPGLDHCGVLPGPGGITAAVLDPLTPLEAWLNDGSTPQSIIAK